MFGFSCGADKELKPSSTGAIGLDSTKHLYLRFLFPAGQFGPEMSELPRRHFIITQSANHVPISYLTNKFYAPKISQNFQSLTTDLQMICVEVTRRNLSLLSDFFVSGANGEVSPAFSPSGEGFEIRWHHFDITETKDIMRASNGLDRFGPGSYQNKYSPPDRAERNSDADVTEDTQRSERIDEGNSAHELPFGFSVGDFLAVSKLTWDVVHALRENAGSIQEVQAILEALMSFQRAISTCQTLALEWSQLSDGDVTLPERSLVNGVNHQLKLCHAKLERLATRIEQYTRSFMKQSGTRTARDQFVKLKWMFNKAEAESLQRDLVTHVQGLEAFISTLGIQVIMRTVKKFESYGAAMTSTGQKVTEIHKTLNTLHQELPKLLGYAWEGGFSAHDRPIILMDALGRTVPIPYLFYVQIFHDLLELMFRHLPGHGRVKKDEYNLVVQDSGGLIQTSEWSRMMSPGSIILMNIVVRISASPWELKRGPSIRCPRCNIFVEQRNATARCRRCYRDFGFFEKERILECAPKPVRPPPATLTSSSSSPVNPTRSRPSAVQSRADRAAELVHFQRIHFTRERLVHSWVTPVDLVDVHPSALHLAVESGLLPEVERVLEENVDLEVRDAHDSLFDSSELYGWTPLQRAAYLGHHSIVGSLVCAGSDVNALSHFADRTPLLAAVRSGDLAVVELLLQAGADLNVRSGYFGETALCAAVQSGNLEIVKLLLQARPDLNILSGSLGETALHLAGQLENPVIVELLLESG
ncbi:hypothetical protein K440DRAFT_663648, partial [Wilcoxina mikolae CBS 423.85]